MVAVALLALFLLGGAPLLLSAAEGDGHGHGSEIVGVGEAVEVKGALLRVDAVRPEVMAAMTMPASLMPDMVPDGYRRFTVDLTVLSRSSKGFEPSPELFEVEAEGLGPVAPVRSVSGTGPIPKGAQASVSMTFQTPIDVEPVFLRIRGTDTRVQLEGDLGSGHGHTAAPDDTVLSGSVDVTIADYRFAPNHLIVRAGTRLTFTNTDAARHNATDRDGTWKTGDLNQADAAAPITFDREGTFSFYCTIHPSMVGEIDVVAATR